MLDIYKIPVGAKPLPYLKERLAKENNSRTVVILPTNRNLRTFASYAKWELDIQTVSEFTKRANKYPGMLLPKELRGYFLYRSAKTLSPPDLHTMMRTKHIDPLESYIRFIQKSSSLLPFFRELAVEGIESARLKTESMYQDYEEQVDLLDKLWNIYCGTVRREGFYDEWECYAKPQLDQAYISRYDRFIFLIGGYLNNYELSQLEAISQNRHVSLYFNYIGDSHHQSVRLKTRFNTDIITEENDVTPTFSHIKITPCVSTLAEYDLITKKILEEHINNNVPFYKMAVVLPDAKLAPLFIHSDPYNLYNVSAGRSLGDFPFFEVLSALEDIVRTQDYGKISLISLKKFSATFYFQNDTLKTFISKELDRGALYINLDSIPVPEIQNVIKPFLVYESTYSEILKHLITLCRFIKAETRAVEELDRIFILFDRIKEPAPAKELLTAILRDLALVSVPVNKGKVAVIGLLESRNMQYDYLFIGGMNSSSFPAKQGKDLFLNTDLRKRLQLPTFADREELQKNYFYQIITRAQKVLITYTAADSDEPSLFLSELQTEPEPIYNPNEYIIIPNIKTFLPPKTSIHKDKHVLAALENFTYSATALNVYKKCPLQFFYRYIKKLKPPVGAIDDFNSGVIGRILHKTMEVLAHNHITPDKDEYLSQIEKIFDEIAGKYDYLSADAVGMFQAKVIKESFPRIAAQEKERFNLGILRQKYEDTIDEEFFGLKFSGTIDRWDLTTKGYVIIDYKYRNVEDSTEKSFEKMDDIQLPLYTLMMEKHHGSPPAQVLWFGFKGDGFVPAFDTARLSEFRDYLETIISDIFAPLDFRGATDDGVCKRCPYVGFCGETLI